MILGQTFGGETVDWSYMDQITKMKGIVQPDGVQRINILMDINDPRKPSWRPDPETKRLINEGRFGIGTARTVDQAYEYAGFSPVDLKMHVNKCGNLKWVPFEDRPEFNELNDWGVGINLQRRIWNESEPLLPPPPGAKSVGGVYSGASSSQSRALQSGASGNLHPFSHGSTYHSAGWICMTMLVIGGILQRSGILKSTKASKSL